MGTLVKTGTVTIPGTTDPVLVTGLGFAPRAVIFFGGNLHTNASSNNASTFYGVATDDNAWCASRYTQAGGGNVGQSGMIEGMCILDWNEVTDSTAVQYGGSNSDGFELWVTQTSGIPTVVNYIAIGGASVSAKVGTFLSTTGIGTQTVTGIGFPVKATLFGATIVSATPENASGTLLPLSVGWGVSATMRGVSASFSSASVPIPAAASLVSEASCLAVMSSKTVVAEQADYFSSDPDGFTVKWTTKSATSFKVGYLALGGAAQYSAGGFTMQTSIGAQIVTGAGFSPLGVLLASSGTTSSTPVADSMVVMGAGSIDGSFGMSMVQQDGQAISTQPRLQFTTTAALRFLRYTDAVASNASVTSMDYEGFTLNWSSASADARRILYFAVGDVEALNATRLTLADRIKETSTSTGTGVFTLGGAVTGFRAWSSKLPIGGKAPYTIEAVDVNNTPTGAWESGIGTLTSATTLERTIVLETSYTAANIRIDFAAGKKLVFLSLPSYAAQAMSIGSNLFIPSPNPGAPLSDIQPYSTRVLIAATGSRADVQAAVDTALPGAVVQIPEGVFDWGVEQLNVPGGIHVRGAGKARTKILRRGSVSESDRVIMFDGSNGLPCRMSDLSMEGNNTPGVFDYGVGMENGCVDFQVFNCAFTKFVWAPANVAGSQKQRGVFYRCDFIDNFNVVQGDRGYGIRVRGAGSYPPLQLGTGNAVFVEDCYFRGQRFNLTAENGARVVIRYNTFVGTDDTKDFSLIRVYGVTTALGTPYPTHSARSYEIYKNVLVFTGGGVQNVGIELRGGDGVVFGNTIPQNVARPIQLNVEGFTCGTYPGVDQIRSLYIWDNNISVNTAYTTNGIDNQCTSSIQLNRDYFLSAPAGYSPYAYPHPLRTE